MHQGIEPGDLQSLLSVLRELSLPEDFIDELSPAIDEDEPVRRAGIGPRVSRWLARVGEKVATNSAAGLATQAVLKYYELTAAGPPGT